MAKTSRLAETETRNIFTWLDAVRERPLMYVQSLTELQAMIFGYREALGVHRIAELGPTIGCHFLYWVTYRTPWATNYGWAHAIETHVSDRQKQFEKFFRLVDEFRQLEPTVLCTVRLTKAHLPTGKRVIRGIDGRIEKPSRVDIVRYVPEPLHFLRLHYPNGIIHENILLERYGVETTIHDAKRWVRDELQVKHHEWRRVE